MPDIAKPAKAKSIPCFFLLLVVAALIAAPSVARADCDPRLKDAQRDVIKASLDETNDTDKAQLLQDAQKLLVSVPGNSRLYHGHKGDAAKEVSNALQDLQSNASPDKFKQDIGAAMDQLKVTIMLAGGVPLSADAVANGDNSDPNGDNALGDSSPTNAPPATTPPTNTHPAGAASMNNSVGSGGSGYGQMAPANPTSTNGPSATGDNAFGTASPTTTSPPNGSSTNTSPAITSSTNTVPAPIP